MNKALFGIAVYMSVVARYAIYTVMGDSGNMYIPDFLWLLLAFVCLNVSSASVAVFSSILIGLVLDLTRPLLGDTQNLALIGPYTLGALIAGSFLQNIRKQLFPDSTLALVAMTCIASAVTHTIANMVCFIRGLSKPLNEPIDDWGLGDAFIASGIEVAFTLGLALCLSWLLIKTKPFWGFEKTQPARRFG